MAKARRKPARAKPAPKKPKPKPAAKPKPRKPKAAPKPKRSPAKTLMALGTGAYGGGLWAIVERVKRISKGDRAVACEAFTIQLDALDDAALVATDREFTEAMIRSYDYGLWGAAYLIFGGCGDDTFWDFRAGLIALGKEIFEAALANPDSLAAIDDIENRTLFEGFQYIPGKLIEQRGLPSAGFHMTDKPSGENWTEDSELEQRFPKLAAKFN